MARRISLPSSDELFGDRGPYTGRSADTDATVKADAGSQTTGSPGARRKAPQRRRPAARKPAASPKAEPAKVEIPVASLPRAARAQSSGGSGPSRRRRGAAAASIEGVEGRLRDLPIDTLLELRDGLEGLLVAGAVTDADVERLLASTDLH